MKNKYEQTGIKWHHLHIYIAKEAESYIEESGRMNASALNEQLAQMDGCTMDAAMRLVNKARGYYVALTDNAVVDTIETEVQKLRNIAETLCLQDYFFGYWRDQRTGTQYIDLSVHVTSKPVALSLAKMHNQKAIFDCRNLDCIYLN